MRIRKDKRGKEMTVSEEFRADVASSNWAESPVAAAMNAETPNWATASRSPS